MRKGVLPSMLEEILKTRIMVKQSMKAYKHDKVLMRLLDARQLGLKLIANVTFGYTSAGYSGRMPCVEVSTWWHPLNLTNHLQTSLTLRLLAGLSTPHIGTFVQDVLEAAWVLEAITLKLSSQTVDDIIQASNFIRIPHVSVFVFDQVGLCVTSWLLAILRYICRLCTAVKLLTLPPSLRLL